MTQLSKESIIAAYHEVVRDRGELIGGTVFARETGISPYYWRGGYWRSWSAFQAESGVAPNSPTQRINDEVLLRRFAELAAELDRIPSQADLRLKRRADRSFPGEDGYRRWGDRNALLARVSDFCVGKPELSGVLDRLKRNTSSGLDHRVESFRIKGFVYLLRSGKHYKLGRSNAVGRRLRELAIQLPKKPDTVHVIETDDPEGIEGYWHSRFASKREGGEWFVLSPEDVRAFKKRRFQ